MSSIMNQNFWTAISILIAVFSLYYNYKTYIQKAVIEVFIGTDQIEINDPSLKLIFDSGYSQNFNFDVSIHNLGEKSANSVDLILSFNSEVKILETPNLGEYWKENNVIKTSKVFTYHNDNKMHPSKTNYSIGKFAISIPLINQLNSGYYFIANGTINGDFEVSCILILYNFDNDKLEIRHFQKGNINDGNYAWNSMLLEKNKLNNK
jgi:hypothetical protein